MSDVLKERRAGERRCEKVREKLATAEAEVARLRAALDSDKAGMYAAGLTLEAEVVRLRAAGQRCMEISTGLAAAGIVGHMGILDVMGVALRGVSEPEFCADSDAAIRQVEALSATVHDLSVQIEDGGKEERALQAEIERLRIALEELVTYQNGSPLPSYDEGWANAMRLADAALRGDGEK